MSTYPTMNFVTRDPNFNDYRPAVGSGGTVAVFERTPIQSGNPTGNTSLYVVDDLSNPAPTAFIPSGGPAVQTRPDWCWETDEIAYNGQENGISVWIVNSIGTSTSQIQGTAGLVYPAWSQDGSTLAVLNGSSSANPIPSTSQINTGGTVRYSNMNGDDADGVAMFGGMPAVNPNDDTLIAFAGQPDLPPPLWPAGHNTNYSQDANYIFLNSLNGSTFSSAPLEPDAPIGSYDENFQGRAPAWSPDGRYIVFESGRTGTGYAIFLFDTQNPSNAPVQLTDSSYQCQHAKFFPNGTQLILVALQRPGTSGSPNGIAWIDISTYVN